MEEEIPRKPMSKLRTDLSDPESRTEAPKRSSCEEKGEGSSSEEEESPAESALTGLMTPSSVFTTGGQCHHSKKKCPVEKCSFFRNDLKRHLNVHVRKGNISEEQVAALVRYRGNRKELAEET